MQLTQSDLTWANEYFKIANDDLAANLATEKINRAIKSVARIITKTSLPRIHGRIS